MQAAKVSLRRIAFQRTACCALRRFAHPAILSILAAFTLHIHYTTVCANLQIVPARARHHNASGADQAAESGRVVRFQGPISALAARTNLRGRHQSDWARQKERGVGLRRGVGVGDGAGVRVLVRVGVGVGVWLGVGDAVRVGVKVRVGDGEAVGDKDGVVDGVKVKVRVGVLVAVKDAVAVTVRVALGVQVSVGVGVGVSVGVGDGVGVEVTVGGGGTSPGCATTSASSGNASQRTASAGAQSGSPPPGITRRTQSPFSLRRSGVMTVPIRKLPACG